LTILSGVLLFAAFPAYNVSILAWVALVPLFLVLSSNKAVVCFIMSLVFGVVFYTGVFFWMFDLSKYRVLHHAVLGVYLTPLMGFFGLAFYFIASRLGHTTALLAAPFIWVSLEYFRSNLWFLSLPWGLLAHSQYQHPTVIQIASITGAYGVSFLIVLVNSALTAILHPLLYSLNKRQQIARKHLTKKGIIAVASTAAFFLLLTLSYGFFRILNPISGEEIKVSLIQGNIEQSKKWDAKYASFIMQTYADLSQKASKENPMLIIWPETATPAALSENYGLYRQVKQIAQKTGAPILTGSSERQKLSEKKVLKASDRKYLNSAFLIRPRPEKEKSQKYDKIRLLPFGEYMPMRGKISWSHLRIPTIEGFVPGKEWTVFRLTDFNFSVTICWENLFPEMVRQFARKGAQFIVNITNEAWFGKSAAPYQFLSMSVFRAVENRFFIVRCANTGISCIIDSQGRIVSRLQNNDGQDLFVRGILTGSVILSHSETFFTKFGDVFVYLSLMMSAAVLFFSVFNVKKTNTKASV
jgi:apolipoprotein N-acyltransferase